MDWAQFCHKRSLTSTEKAYTTWELETLAVVWAIRLFGWYYWGSEVKVRTDSNAVSWVLEQYTIEHREGKKHGNADALSRCPHMSTCPYRVKVDSIYGDSPPIVVGALSYFPPEDKEAWNRSDFTDAQAKDATCKRIKDKVTAGDSAYAAFEVDKNGTVWKKADERRDRCMVVPDSLKAFILRRHHGLPMSGHKGRSKVYKAMAKRFLVGRNEQGREEVDQRVPSLQETQDTTTTTYRSTWHHLRRHQPMADDGY